MHRVTGWTFRISRDWSSRSTPPSKNRAPDRSKSGWAQLPPGQAFAPTAELRRRDADGARLSPLERTRNTVIWRRGARSAQVAVGWSPGENQRIEAVYLHDWRRPRDFTGRQRACGVVRDLAPADELPYGEFCADSNEVRMNRRVWARIRSRPVLHPASTGLCVLLFVKAVARMWEYRPPWWMDVLMLVAAIVLVICDVRGNPRTGLREQPRWLPRAPESPPHSD